MTEDGFERLAQAIILQAAKDYRGGLKRYKRTGRENDDVRRGERFFKSDWFKMLSGVDGEYIIKKLREEAGV